MQLVSPKINVFLTKIISNRIDGSTNTGEHIVVCNPLAKPGDEILLLYFPYLLVMHILSHGGRFFCPEGLQEANIVSTSIRDALEGVP